MTKKYKVSGFNVIKGDFTPYITEFTSDSKDENEIYSIGFNKLINSVCHSFALSDITIWEPRFLGVYDLSGNYEVIYPKRVITDGECK